MTKKVDQLAQFVDLKGGLGKKEGVVFLMGGGGGLIPQCILLNIPVSNHVHISVFSFRQSDLLN